MQCSKCPRNAIVFQSYSGLHLCDQHVAEDVKAKAKKMIRAHQWLRYGDHISVALSDNKSAALLYFLKQLTAERRDIRISAITINQESTGFNINSHAKRIAELLDTECFTGSSEDESVTVFDTISQKAKDPTMSVYCHPHRCLPLDKVAQQHGVTKIALGITLDDAACAVLESVIRGDVERLGFKHCVETIPRISPFISVTAAEVSLYAAHCGFKNEPAISPDLGDGLHKDTVALLDRFTNNHPATKYALMNLGKNLAGFPGGISGLIRACEWLQKKPAVVL
ncbi:MAG: tRNA(Ile)-lysidine synthase [Methanoregula sp.]|nr:tRNA(Ile)-lysidine synthase [Methanoregula sp.]